MSVHFSPKNNPRLLLYKIIWKIFNKDAELSFPEHDSKFIKDVVNGTIERDEIIKAKYITI